MKYEIGRKGMGQNSEWANYTLITHKLATEEAVKAGYPEHKGKLFFWPAWWGEGITLLDQQPRMQEYQEYKWLIEANLDLSSITWQEKEINGEPMMISCLPDGTEVQVELIIQDEDRYWVIQSRK